MQTLQCKICGDTDIYMLDENLFQCGTCKCKYTLEQVRLILSGQVEFFKDTAELERLLSDVRQLIILGEFTTATKKSEALTDEFPSDYRTWWERARVKLDALANKYVDLVNLPLEENALLKYYKNALSIADGAAKDQITREWA